MLTDTIHEQLIPNGNAVEWVTMTLKRIIRQWATILCHNKTKGPNN